MKVLYILAHFPQASESYVEAEMAYLASVGVEVQVWSPLSGYGDAPKVPVHRRSLLEARNSFRPDVIHIHHMTTAEYYLDELPPGSASVRAHSFDWTDERAARVVRHPAVRRLYVFPHMVSRAPSSEKVAPLPVAYDPSIHYPTRKDRLSVFRLSACLPTKCLDDFLVVGNRIPEARFTLGVNLVIGKESLVDRLNAVNRSLGSHVTIRANLSRAEASWIFRSGNIYLGTSDPSSHPFGMPISIAEAMATGTFVTTKRNPAAESYVADPELLYSSVAEAEQTVRRALELTESERRDVSERAVEKAQQYRTDVVLGRVLRDWESFIR